MHMHSMATAARVASRSSQWMSRRGMATASSGSFHYETGTAAGVKIAGRSMPGPVTNLAVVAKAGTRYQPLPGFSEGLERFGFKNTERRSALRITREAELLGSELVTYHSRENLILGARFLKEDLPYFAELLSEVITETKYTEHELHEEVERVIEIERKALLADPLRFALSSAHGVAFHRGLGNPLHPVSSTPAKKYIQADLLKQYSQAAYAKSNIAVVANGPSFQELDKWVGSFFAETPASPPSNFSTPGIETTKYYGGEERISHAAGNAMVIAFPGSSSFTGTSYKPEIAVLAALLGGHSTIKWNTGFSLLSRATQDQTLVQIDTKHHTYSDAGLLAISIAGPARQVAEASKGVAQALMDTASGKISQEDFTKARATARFNALESGQNVDTGIELTGAGLIAGGKAFQIDDLGKKINEVTEAQLKQVAKTLLDGKASVSSVGDLFVLPYAQDIGLKI